MADNPTVSNGDLGAITWAADDISSVFYQKVKLVYGGDDAATAVTSSAGLPVETELTLFDLDTGGGTVSAAGVALLVGASGGPVALTGDATYGLDVDVTRMPAAARTTDSLSATLSSDKLMNNLTACTPVSAVIDHASSGDNTLLAAQGSGNIIVVHQVMLVSSGTVNVRFESGASGTALTGQMQLTAQTGFVLPFSPIGWFRTAANTLLNLELSGATSVDGVFSYTVVT